MKENVSRSRASDRHFKRLVTINASQNGPDIRSDTTEFNGTHGNHATTSHDCHTTTPISLMMNLKTIVIIEKSGHNDKFRR